VLTGQIRGRNGAFLDWEQRRAGCAIEHEDEGGLGRLHDRIDRRSVALHRDQHRRRGQVVVPQVVVDGLEVPDALASRGAQRHHRIGEEVGAGTIGAVEVGARRTDRQEHQTALEVGGDRRPHIGGAGVAPAVVLPGIGAELAGPRDGAERPQQPPAARVEGAHVAGRRDATQRVGDR
jgi:hypothetical protein